MSSGTAPRTGTGNRTAVLAVTTATVLFGSGPVVAALTPVPTEVIVVLRFVLVAPLLVVGLLAVGRRLSPSVLRRCIPGGLLLPLQVGLFFGAARRTSVADATFIISLQPGLMLFVTPRLFRERNSLATVAWVAAGIGGVGLVIYGSAQSGTVNLVGELLAVASLFVWTGYLIASKWARSGATPVPALEYQASVNLIGALGMTAVAVIAPVHWPMISTAGWAGVVYLAAATGIVGHVLNTWAQRYVDQTVVSMILLAQPVVAMVGAAAFLDQPIGVWALGGAAVVLASAVKVVSHSNAMKGIVR